MKKIHLAIALAALIGAGVFLGTEGYRQTPETGPIVESPAPSPVTAAPNTVPAVPDPVTEQEVMRLRREMDTMKQRFLAFADAASLKQAQQEAAITRLRYDLAAARRVPVSSIVVPDLNEEIRTSRYAAERLAEIEAENRRQMEGYEKPAPRAAAPERARPVEDRNAAAPQSRDDYYERREPARQQARSEPQRERGFFESLRDAFRPGQPPEQPYDFVHGQ